MPELPEVETLTRQLKKAITGKKTSDIKVLRTKSFQGNLNLIIGKKIISISRKAKVIIIRFGGNFPALLIHLKMTGQLIYQTKNKKQETRNFVSFRTDFQSDTESIQNNFNSTIIGGHPTLDWISSLPSKHTRVILTFTDKSILYFNDMRVFGWLKIITSQSQFDQETKNINGIEPLTPNFTLDNFKKALSKSTRPIKLTLLDQAKIAGLGNIYVNDSLFNAGILPFRPTSSLTQVEIKKLHASIEKILSLGIKYGGTSQSTYKQLNGLAGSYQDHFLVYRKEREPCPKCKCAIIRTKLGGRGTFHCPFCQK